MTAEFYDCQPDGDGHVTSLSKQGFHNIAYVEFGNPNSKRVAVCVHGLSRNGRDFDKMAAAMARKGWRVICPDLVGRGRSDWLRDPEEYNLPQYALDMTVLIARLGVPSVDWIGTSLGGLIGLVLAGQQGAPIRRLVLNDIGPYLSWQALHALAAAVRNAPRNFADLATAASHYSQVLAPFGRLSEGQWRHLARHSLGQLPDGTLRKLSDPDITAAFKPGWMFNLSLWNYWDKVKCPTLTLRGIESVLVNEGLTKEMARRGPRSDTIVMPDCGHAPALMDPRQIEQVIDWLEKTRPLGG